MSERIVDSPRSVPELYDDLTDHAPKLVTTFVPKNAVEQKQAFLAGEIENPAHDYDRLAAIDFEKERLSIDRIGEMVLHHAELEPKYREAYEQFIETYKKQLRIQELAVRLRAPDGFAEKTMLEYLYRTTNAELYGEPDGTVYQSLLQEKLHSIADRHFEGRAAGLRDELLAMTPLAEQEQVERFRPSPETVEWIHDAAHALYDGMLRHVPEGKDVFEPVEVQGIFSKIIQEEFGEAAEDWQVDLVKGQAIAVKASERRVVIPENRDAMNATKLRELIAHELGVHMFRSIMGEQSDLNLLRSGLNDYYDSEEGLGKVMEQALSGEFKEVGVDHYITAGLVHYDGMDFRHTFETKWRLSVLGKLGDNEKPTDKMIAAAKDAAYKQTMRSLRGTDYLPWFKDLAYYNGTANMWQYLEKIRGDDFQLTLALLGKADPAQMQHKRVLLETKSIQ